MATNPFEWAICVGKDGKEAKNTWNINISSYTGRIMCSVHAACGRHSRD